MQLSFEEALVTVVARIFKRSIFQNTMDDTENLFFDESLLFGDSSWDCEGCAPPIFDLPPPPRPPWLEDLEDCGSKASLSDVLSQLETCDSTVIRDHQTLFDDTFHSIAVIVVSAIVLVVILLVGAVMIFRRQKRLHLHSRECHPSNPLGVDHHHQFGGQKEVTVPQQFVVTEVVAGSNGLLHTMTKSMRVPSCDNTLRRIAAVTALTRNGHTMTRCCGNLEAHFQKHYNNNGLANSLPNHYIADLQRQQQQLQGQLPKREYNLSEIRQKISPPNCTVMELSERPPTVRTTSTLQSTTYPHIIIGGKPFYLIPTSMDEHGIQVDGSFESYSYPQHVPIYEEIDGEGSDGCGRFYEPASEMEYSSEQGEVGSTERLAYHHIPETVSIQRSPRIMRSLFGGGNATPSQHRSLSSHSQNSSQQTNTSEISSSNSSTSSTSNPNLHTHHLQQHLSHPHYVQLEPELDQVHLEEWRRRVPTMYENSHVSKPSNVRKSSSLTGARLADGIERCRSPQSIYSARLANKAAQSPANSPNRSVYYYSDTMKKDGHVVHQDSVSKQSTIKEGFEESFTSEDDNLNESKDSSTRQVSTKIILEDPSLSTAKGSATLV